METADARGAVKRVLVVDDSVDTARMMKVLLKREGFEARTAFDGPQAIEAAAEFLPDAVLLDLTLPGMSGRDVALELRRNESLAGVLIVAISGHALVEPPPGFDHMMVKPFDHDALIKLLSGRAGR